MGNTTVTGSAFVWDDLLAGDFPLITDRVTIKTGQGVLPRGTALGRALLTCGAAVAGTHTGTETIAQPTLQAGAMAGVYKLLCTAAPGGVGTFAVFNPKGERLADAVQAVAYSDQLGFTIAGGGSAVNDTYTITVSSSANGLAVGNIAEGENGGQATLTTASTLAAAIAGEYVLTCTAVNEGVGTYSVVGPGGALANATQAVAYSTQLSFTIGGGAPAEGDTFIITVVPATIEYVVCNSANVDGSQTLYAILADDDGADTTAGDVQATIYVAGKFNRGAVSFATGDSYANHLTDKATIFLVAIHP